VRTNKVKARIKAGETVFGCFVRFPDAGLVEFLALQGWDFFVFDGEHGTVMPEDCEHMTRAAELRDVAPFARVTTNEASTILRYMDTGLQGAHVPWVNSPAEAEAAVKAIKYYPRGVRGLAGARAADYGQREPLGEYVKKANAETLVTLQIETETAVNQVAEIAAVEDVDVIFLGPSDLSHSLGVPGELNHPKVIEALEHVTETVKQTDRTLGIYVGTVEMAKDWQKRGARYIATGVESLLKASSQNYFGTLRG